MKMRADSINSPQNCAIYGGARPDFDRNMGLRGLNGRGPRESDIM